jgi:hypothetical protein
LTLRLRSCLRALLRIRRSADFVFGIMIPEKQGRKPSGMTALVNGRLAD